MGNVRWYKVDSIARVNSSLLKERAARGSQIGGWGIGSDGKGLVRCRLGGGESLRAGAVCSTMTYFTTGKDEVTVWRDEGAGRCGRE